MKTYSVGKQIIFGLAAAALILAVISVFSGDDTKQGDLSNKAEVLFHAKALGMVSAAGTIRYLGKPSWVILPGDIIGDDTKPYIYKTDPIQFMLKWKAEPGCTPVSATFDHQGMVSGWDLGKTCSGDDMEYAKAIDEGLKVYAPFSCDKPERTGYCVVE